MTKKGSTGAVIEVVFASFITSLIINIMTTGAIFSVIGFFIGLIPFSLICLRNGFTLTMISGLLCGILSSILINPIAAIIFTMIFLTTGLVLGYSIKKENKAIISITLLFLAIFFSFAIGIKAISIVTGTDIIKTLINNMENTMSSAINAYKSMNAPENVINAAKQLLNSIGIIKSVFPAMLILHAVLQAFISYAITSKILRKIGYNVDRVKPLSQWYISFGVATPIIIIYLISVGMSYSNYQNGDLYLLNAQILFYYLFWINGIAVVAHFLNKYNIVKSMGILIIISTIIIIPTNILMVVGIIDYVINLRKLDKGRRPKV